MPGNIQEYVELLSSVHGPGGVCVFVSALATYSGGLEHPGQPFDVARGSCLQADNLQPGK